MSDVQYETFQHYGTNAQRVAFTPSPAAGIQPIYVWYETDTGKTFLYDTTWHQIASASGGGIPTVAQGDLLYGSAANTLSALAKDANATRYLSNTGASNNPAWAQVNLADGVTGDLPYANLTQGSALSVLGVTGNATADVASIAAGTDGFVLRRSGTALSFGTLASGAFPTSMFVPLVAEVTLTDAQIKTLPTATVTIVSAPGAGLAINYLCSIWVSNFASVYTNISATGYAFMAWAGAESPGLASAYVPNDAGLSLTQYSDLFGSTTRKILQLPPYTNTDSAWGNIATVVSRTARENQAMCISAAQAGSDFTGGNASNTLLVRVYYTIEVV